MRTSLLIRAVAAIALFASACGPVVGAPVATPSAQSQSSCGAQASRCLALVTLRGGTEPVVLDMTDFSHPTTVSTLGTTSPARFVSATELSFVDSSGLIRTPLAGSPTTVVAKTPQISLFDWNQDGTSVVYLAQTDTGMDLHQINAGPDRVVGSTPSSGVGGCEDIAGCAIANSVDFRLFYSPNGTYISLVSSGFGKSVFRIWSADGRLLKSSDSLGPTMSVWTGAGLYFRDAGGVTVWRAGAVSTFLPGVSWIRPKASPDGGQIVYVTRDSGGWADSYVVDTASGTVRELNARRAEPVFLTSRYVWYQGERECVPADGCGANPPFHPLSGKAYIYDLQTGTETESTIASVWDVWPHSA